MIIPKISHRQFLVLEYLIYEEKFGRETSEDSLFKYFKGEISWFGMFFTLVDMECAGLISSSYKGLSVIATGKGRAAYDSVLDFYSYRGY